MVIEQHGKLRMPLFTPQPIALQQRHTDSAFPLVLTPAHEEINFDEIAQQREALMACSRSMALLFFAVVVSLVISVSIALSRLLVLKIFLMTNPCRMQ